jgi:hypothetical protein
MLPVFEKGRYYTRGYATPKIPFKKASENVAEDSSYLMRRDQSL